MKYYVTIYIDPLIECFMSYKEKCLLSIEGATHAFLGLTHEHPSKLDTMKFERETNKQIWSFQLGKMIYLKEEYKWYDTTETNEFNDGFWGFGPENFAFSYPVYKSGKVFENNQLIGIEL